MDADGLADRLARGDSSAFAELYDACADRVHHFLVVRLGSRPDADDAMQETFVRLARSREALAGVKDLMAYVFTIARREAIRLAGRRSREDRARSSLAGALLFEPEAADGRASAETAEWVAASLARIGVELREVVELRIYAGLTFREIAEVTGLPQGTVATRYRSALEKMRGQLAEGRE